MPHQIHHLHASFEVSLTKLESYFENNPTLPDGVESVEYTRKNSTITITSETSDKAISRYVPTCAIKGTVSERRVYPEDSTPRDRYDEENPGELIEFACFKGDLDSILVNTELRAEMFELLCTLAEQARCGDLKAAYTTNDTLETVIYQDGTQIDSTFDVIPTKQPDSSDPDAPGVAWTQNKYIS